MTVRVYSGYRLAALRAQPARFGSLLDETDILIDGEYRRELPGPFPWRGSSNQVVHLLRQQADATPPAEQPVREMQVSLTANGVRLSGFPSPAVEASLAERLRARGILLKPAKHTTRTDGDA
jgi:hypothetical protein